MRLPASLKFLLGTALALLAAGQSAAQQPDYQPLQPDKIEWAEQVGRHARVRKDSNLLAEYHYLYGKIYEASGNYLEAKRHYLQSLRIQEARRYTFALTRLYQHLHTIESLQMNRSEAIRYARLGLQAAERINSDEVLLRAYGMMTFLYMNREAADTLFATDTPKAIHDSALYYLHKTEPIARRIGRPFDLVVLDHLLGGEMLRKKDRKALAYFRDALEISKELNKPYEQVISMQNLAGAYLTFGQHEKAYGLIKRAEVLHATLPHENRMIMRGLEALYTKYYRAVGNWKAALEHTQKLHELEKGNLLSDRDGAVTRLGMEFENEKKEVQLASQRKELALKSENIQTQRWLLFVVSALLLLAVGGVAVYYRLFRQKARIGRQNAELVQEQNHRVKNNLQVVSGLLQLQANRLSDKAAIAALEDTQSRLKVMAALQMKLYENDRLTPVRAAEFVRQLVEMSLESFGCQDVVVNYDIPDTLEVPLDHALPVGLIVNELTTNACKYAFADHEAPALTIEMRRQGSQQDSRQGSALSLRVADNGGGFKPSPVVKGGEQSLGMKIIDLQVKQLHGQYSFNATEGTTFRMNFKV